MVACSQKLNCSPQTSTAKIGGSHAPGMPSKANSLRSSCRWSRVRSYGRIATDRARIASFEAAVRLVNDSTANRVPLSGSATDSGVRATVVASSRQDRGVLVVEGLPPLAPGRVYELWGLAQGDLGKAAKAAVFRFNDNPGVRTVAFSVPIQPTTGFAITNETGPFGNEHPTTSPLLMGSPQSPGKGRA